MKNVKDLQRDAIMVKAKNGLPLNLGQLALVSGYGPAKWRKWRFRGLPLVDGKISLDRALEWVASQTAAAGTRTAKMYDLCEEMSVVISDARSYVRWSANEKKPTNTWNEQGRKQLYWDLDRLHLAFYNLMRDSTLTDAPAYSGQAYRRATATENTTSGSHQPSTTTSTLAQLGIKPPFSKTQETALCKAENGLALNQRELGFALGYSSSTIKQWKRAGLPLVDGKITRDAAWHWAKHHRAKAVQSDDEGKITP